MSPPAPGRLALVGPLTAAWLLAVHLPAAADEAPLGPDPAPAVASARAAAQGAQASADAADGALALAQQGLATARTRLGQLLAQEAALDGRIAQDTAEVQRIRSQIELDRHRLYAFVRGEFEADQNSAFIYIMAADSFPEAIRRKAEVESIGGAGTVLVRRLDSERSAAQAVLDDARRQRERLAVDRQQAATAEVLVSTQEEAVQAAQQAAHQGLDRSNSQLAGAIHAKQAYDTEQAARAARAAEAERAAARERAAKDSADHGSGPPEPDVVYSPIAGSTFTVDTDLTLPSGETAERLNHYLDGSALAGLGDSFMAAEHDHHVSARYFVAHAIEESSFGTSEIAQRKHNLFGFGADDANPYQDAVTFPSFQACIDYVSGYIYRHYLTPGGSFYHGPTLRGMNVDYASDPHWADNIARIARSIP